LLFGDGKGSIHRFQDCFVGCWVGAGMRHFYVKIYEFCRWVAVGGVMMIGLWKAVDSKGLHLDYMSCAPSRPFEGGAWRKWVVI
jgi:hypothetical protein